MLNGAQLCQSMPFIDWLVQTADLEERCPAWLILFLAATKQTDTNIRHDKLHQSYFLYPAGK